MPNPKRKYTIEEARAFAKKNPEAYNKALDKINPDPYRGTRKFAELLINQYPDRFKGLKPENFLSMLDSIAKAESPQGNVIQRSYNKKTKKYYNGPARGYFQIETTSAPTFSNRYKAYQDILKPLSAVPLPDIKVPKSGDVRSLSRDEQARLALANMSTVAAVKKEKLNPFDSQNSWLNFHWNGSPADKPARQQHWKETFGYGGGGSIKPYITNDPNDPRIQAYRDSSDLYSDYRIQQELLKTQNPKAITNHHLDYSKNKSLQDSNNSNKPDFYYKPRDIDNLIINQWKRKNNPNIKIIEAASPEVTHSTIKPKGVYMEDIENGLWNSTDTQRAWNNDYSNVKPIQPVIYQKPQSKETSKTIGQTWSEKINVPTIKPKAKPKPIQQFQDTVVVPQVTPEAQTQINTGSSTPVTLGMSSPNSTTGKRLYRLGNKNISEQEFNRYKTLGQHKIVEYGEGGEIEPTRADSLALLNNTNALNKYYSDKKYRKGEVELNNTPPKYIESGNLDWFNSSGSSIKDNAGRTNLRATPQGLRKVSQDEYYRNIDKNKFLIREGANSVLDTNAPPALFDRRINSTSRVQYENIDKNSNLQGDQVDLFGYDPLSITPWDMLTPEQQKQRVAQFGNNGTPYTNKKSGIKINEDKDYHRLKPPVSKMDTINKKIPVDYNQQISTDSPVIVPQFHPYAGYNNPNIPKGYYELGQGKKIETFKEGGEIYYSDPNKFIEAQQAYNDSTNYYNFMHSERRKIPHGADPKAWMNSKEANDLLIEESNLQGAVMDRNTRAGVKLGKLPYPTLPVSKPVFRPTHANGGVIDTNTYGKQDVNRSLMQSGGRIKWTLI